MPWYQSSKVNNLLVLECVLLLMCSLIGVECRGINPQVNNLLLLERVLLLMCSLIDVQGVECRGINPQKSIVSYY
jgi:hypothetical protein